MLEPPFVGDELNVGKEPEDAEATVLDEKLSEGGAPEGIVVIACPEPVLSV